MRDGFESYRTELEGVRLTAESKAISDRKSVV